MERKSSYDTNAKTVSLARHQEVMLKHEEEKKKMRAKLDRLKSMLNKFGEDMAKTRRKHEKELRTQQEAFARAEDEFNEKLSDLQEENLTLLERLSALEDTNQELGLALAAAEADPNRWAAMSSGSVGGWVGGWVGVTSGQETGGCVW